MIELFVIVTGIVLYRWYRPRTYTRNRYSQTDWRPLNKYVQTENMDDSMSLDVSDMDIDDDFFS